MDDIGLIWLAGLVIVLMRGISQTCLIILVVLATTNAGQKRRVAIGPSARGYPQATGRLSVTSAHSAYASLEHRLWELDTLRHRGVIGFEEYAAARHAALHGLADSVRARA